MEIMENCQADGKVTCIYQYILPKKLVCLCVNFPQAKIIFNADDVSELDFLEYLTICINSDKIAN